MSIGNSHIKLLEKLCSASAVSGDEGEVRQIILAEVQKFGGAKVDALGNVLMIKEGRGKNRTRVMLDAHMDEVGFMIVGDDGDGIYRFEIVGGVDVRSLPGKPVWVGKQKIPGVIGARAIHLTTAEERKRKIPVESLRIDVGLGGNGIKIGDRAVFATTFTRLSPNTIRAKAIDDRIGVVTLIELIKSAPSTIDLCAAFAVQEEIGLRGAKIAAQAFAPDLAIAIDSTPANDLPSYDDKENISYNTKLGCGPAIYTYDAGTISDRRLIDFLIETGDKAKIPYQLRQPGGGGTDAAAIHRVLAGIPSVSVSIPGRYHHTAASIVRIDDWKNTVALLEAALKRIKPDILSR
jgi:endoglucanase